MKKMLFILLVLTIVSCSSKDDDGKATHFGYQIVRIGKCQYAIYIKANAATMVHAGDCDNHKP